MPYCNCVTPYGAIVATPERGTFMGNRGILHDPGGRVLRPWQVKRWLVCLLEFRGRKRTVMTPSRYTELFFLDEATALAAGHRPCAECRHARFLDFCKAWKAVHPRDGGTGRPTADEVDARLHAERVGADRSKRSYEAPLDELPDGVFVTLEGSGEKAFLARGERLLEWSPGSYQRSTQRPRGIVVRVLTPRSTVETIRAGYAPEVHPSADQLQ